jgi:hypothetical protein
MLIPRRGRANAGHSMSSSQEDRSYLSAVSPNPSNNSSNETYIDPSPIAPSSNGTEFADLDDGIDPHAHSPDDETAVVHNQVQVPPPRLIVCGDC